ncbi:MAG: glycosyltransferase family 4 protein [Candidatus Micrarchaeota archaeon]|nr:glycosyltransferase family 4 protein [Candidatus Micrarchaeota archaeon]
MLGWEYPPSITGGLGVHCFELVSNLAALGVEVDLFLPKQRAGIFSPHKNVRLIELGSLAQRIGAYGNIIQMPHNSNYPSDIIGTTDEFAKLALAAVRESGVHYDLVHCHDWLTVPAGLAVRDFLKKPLVLTIHSTEFDRNPIPWNWISDIESLGVRSADRTIAVSGRTRAQLAEKYGADAGRLRVIHNGVDAEKFVHRTERHRKEKLVLFLGRLSHQKGPEQFLRAAKRVLDYERNARFLVVGDGPLLPRLLSLSIELGISDRVSFWGFVPENEKHHIYSHCDAYVMPSVSEPFGITSLEAMASGTPCIISKTSGVTEVAKNCLLVDFWDIDEMASQLLALLRYPPLSRTMSQHQIVEVRTLGWRETAKKTIGVYNEVLGN